ncbi:MAG: hypothetical protein AAB358_03220 [Patescibacteria group bacterium]
MIIFEDDYFRLTNFDAKQIGEYIDSAERDLSIAKESDIPEVVFRFAYDAMIKLGIILIAKQGYRVRSAPGHHIKIIEKMSLIVGDEDIGIIGNKIRQKRNLDLYSGKLSFSEKESKEYFKFIESIFKQARNLF